MPRLSQIAALSIATGFMFTVGSVYFLLLSYPKAMDKMVADTMSVDVARLPWHVRYFTFNGMLIACWSFEIAILPFLGIGPSLSVFFCRSIAHISIFLERGRGR